MEVAIKDRQRRLKVKTPSPGVPAWLPGQDLIILHPKKKKF